MLSSLLLSYPVALALALALACVLLARLSKRAASARGEAPAAAPDEAPRLARGLPSDLLELRPPLWENPRVPRVGTLAARHTSCCHADGATAAARVLQPTGVIGGLSFSANGDGAFGGALGGGLPATGGAPPSARRGFLQRQSSAIGSGAGALDEDALQLSSEGDAARSRQERYMYVA